MRVLSLCDGLSCGLLAFKELGIDVEYYAVELDKYARALADSNLPGIIRPCHDVYDLTEELLDSIGVVDWVIFGFPCFVAGTKVFTDGGYKNIEDITIGDMVLTHLGRFRRVIATGRTLAPTREVKFVGVKPIVTTDEHPFLVRDKLSKPRSAVKKFSDEKWVNASEIKPLHTYGKLASISICENKHSLDSEDCWILGRFIADGHYIKKLRSEKGREKDYSWKVIFSVGARKQEEFEKAVKKYHFTKTLHSKSVFRYCISSKHLVELIISLGLKNGAVNKDIPADLLCLPKDLLECVVHGYMSGDGCLIEKTMTYSANSVSENLMLSLQLAVEKVYKTAAQYSFFHRQPTCVIEGREVNQKDTHSLRYFKKNKKKTMSSNVDGGVFTPCKGNISTGESQMVYNMEVEDDNTYTANNIVVHNCQKFSVAGTQGGLQSDPLLLQCMKILNYCKEKNPNLKFLIENVKMKKSLLDEVDAVIQSPFRTMINSALVSAQHRERYYWTNFPVAQPEDRGLVIADILEDECFSEMEKSFCIDASYYKGANADEYLKKSRRQLVFKYSESNRYHRADGPTTQKASEAATREVEKRMIPSDKSLTLTTGDGCGSGMKAINLVGRPRGFNKGYSISVDSNKSPTVGSSSWEQNNLVMQVNPDKSCGGKQPKMQDRIYHPMGKSVAMTSFAGRTNVMVLAGHAADIKAQDMLKREYSPNGKCPTLTAVCGGHQEKKVAIDELHYRKLTVRECARLQTVPEWYSFDAVSKTQAYKAIGNGWTVDVIAHIISQEEWL